MGFDIRNLLSGPKVTDRVEPSEAPATNPKVKVFIVLGAALMLLLVWAMVKKPPVQNMPLLSSNPMMSVPDAGAPSADEQKAAQKAIEIEVAKYNQAHPAPQTVQLPNANQPLNSPPAMQPGYPPAQPYDGQPNPTLDAAAKAEQLREFLPPIQTQDADPPKASTEENEVVKLVKSLQEQDGRVVQVSAVQPIVEKKDNKNKADFSIPIGSTNAWQAYEPGDRNHTIYQGTLIHTILLQDIQSDIPGPVTCETTDDVLSFDRQHVLVPRRTLVFGHTQEINSIGQSRVALLFDYMRMPDAFEMSLDNFAAQDAKGAGITGDVNHHFLRAFGTAAAIGLIGAASMWNANGGYSLSGADTLRYGLGSSMSQSAQQTFNRYALVNPTITIKAMTKHGPTPVEMYVVGDLYPPFYEEHEMALHNSNQLKEEAKK